MSTNSRHEPAFPAGDHSGYSATPGVTVRDWFAGQADEAFEIWKWLYGDEPMPGPQQLCEEVARIRLDIGDAMLKAREET